MAPLRIAVIGAGISGAAAAQQLRVRMGARLGAVCVFERAPRPGGRALVHDVGGRRVELGASVLYSGNMHMVSAARRHALPLERPFGLERDVSAAMWRGGCEEFRVGEGDGAWARAWDAVQMARRYGVRSLARTRWHVGGMLEKFMRIYDEDVQQRVIRTPAALFAQLGVEPLARVTGDEWLRAACGVSREMVDEFVDGIARSNYAQPVRGLNALVNAVSLVGGGFGGDGQLLAVRGGNSAVVRALLDEARATVHCNTRVGRVVRSAAGWDVYVEGSGEPAGCFDGVVVATPFETAGNLRVHGTAHGEPLWLRRPMQRLVVTLLRGRAAARAPDVVLTRSDDAATPFLCMTHVGGAGDGSGDVLWKVFSHEALGREFFAFPQLAAVVCGGGGAARVVHEHVWRGAFPKLSPHAPKPSFALERGLAYTSAMESFVSTMETQAIAGRVVARLLTHDLLHE